MNVIDMMNVLDIDQNKRKKEREKNTRSGRSVRE